MTLINIINLLQKPNRNRSTTKITVSPYVIACSPVERYHERFGGACCLHFYGSNPEDGSSRFLRNVSTFLTYYMVLHRDDRNLIFTAVRFSKLTTVLDFRTIQF
jgi:hypothetical protein